MTATVNPATTTQPTIAVTVSAGTAVPRHNRYQVPLTVKAASSGNALSGASVTLQVFPGTSCSGTAANGTATTDSSGTASFTFTTKQAATYCASATVSDTGYTTGTNSTTFTT